MTSPAPQLVSHAATLDELDARTWHGIARLRQDVFVIEQQCPYSDLDDRDGEPGARQLWLSAPDGSVAATLRILTETDADGAAVRRIGRVVTAAAFRGRGVMAGLLNTALAECAGLPVVIEAQSYLRSWYERFDFVVTGPEFLEDDIPHLPMLRAAVPTR